MLQIAASITGEPRAKAAVEKEGIGVGELNGAERAPALGHQQLSQKPFVEPYTHLKDVLERLPGTTNQEVVQLTPQNWKKACQSQVKLAA